jgi:hypothetical protein
VELFKLYKTVTCVADRNLLWEDVSALIRPEDQIYRYGLVGLEIFGLAIMILAVKYIKKTIEVFKLSEFAMIGKRFGAISGTYRERSAIAEHRLKVNLCAMTGKDELKAK